MCAGDSIAKVSQLFLEKNIYSFSSASPQPQILRDPLFLSKVKNLGVEKHISIQCARKGLDFHVTLLHAYLNQHEGIAYDYTYAQRGKLNVDQT